MSDTGEKSQKERDNLARIRENQRRSRARRKEYLGELETRLRQCEQNGVGATAQVQAAAKQVLAENKRLRALLGFKGISDAEIDAFDLNGVSNGGTYDAIPASMSLEAMLNHRYPCGSSGTREPKPADDANDSPLTQQTRPSHGLPQPNGSDTRACDIHGHSPLQKRQEQQHQQQQGSWGDSTGLSGTTSFSTAPSATALQDPSAYAAESGSLDDWSRDFTDSAAAVTTTSTCSCAEAASMIQHMGGDPDRNLGGELGCDTNDPQCRASSSLVFELLDRYGHSGIGP